MKSLCDCCRGVEQVTPVEIVNPPEQSKLAYRVGTHGQFMASMLARLSAADVPELRSLTARTPDDPSIALLDGWSLVGDVLSFYQERIANEGFLRTATERRSVAELAALLGWRLRPGLAATIYLAYTVDPDPQDPAEPPSEKDRLLTIPAGSKVQDVPDPGALPQTFETIEELEARAWWNNLRPRQTKPLRIDPEDLDLAVLPIIVVAGTTSGVTPGDLLLLIFGDLRDISRIVRVVAVEVDDAAGTTAIRIQRLQDLGPMAVLAAEIGKVLAEAEATRPKGDPKTDPFVNETIAVLLKLAAGADMDVALVEAIEQIGELATRAGKSAKTKAVAPWLQERAVALQAIAVATLPVVEAGGLAEASLPSAGGASPDLDRIVDRLRIAPSRPPGSARALRRSIAGQFGSGSDVARQVLGKGDPMVGGSLYRAMAGADLKIHNPLDEIDRFTGKALPFGATAPRRAVLDAKGAIVGSEEWPLAGEAVVELQQIVGDNEVLDLVVTIRTQDEEITGRFPNDETDTIELGKTVVIADVTTDRAIVEVTGGSMTRRIRIEREPTVSFDDEKPWLPKLGQTVRRSSSTIRRAVSLLRLEHSEMQEILIVERFLLTPDPFVILLDSEYPGILPGSAVVIERPSWLPDPTDASASPPLDLVIATVVASSTVAATAYGISGKVTRLTLSTWWLDSRDLLLSAVRDAVVHVASVPLPLAEVPIPDCVPDDPTRTRIELGRLYAGLTAGRWVIVAGERCDLPGVLSAELAMLGGVVQGYDENLPGDRIHTTIILARPLSYDYVRSTVTVYGNVAKATHGETRTEVLGSADARRSLHSFNLRTKPLTFLPSVDEAGGAAALEVRVDTLRWHEADNLVELGPNDRRYVLRVGDNEVPTVTFGTGVRGARPATGQENVVAKYRIGLGRGGNVAANRATQLMTRPLGVSAVTNPLAATGGADRDSRDQARRTIPLAVESLDRLVSVVDYEHFVRARAGVGQAAARLLTDGRRSIVHVTIAGVDDAPIDRASDLYRTLIASIGEAGDPSIPFVVDLRELITLVIAADVRIDPDRRWEDLEPRIRTALYEAFDFESRRLGQDVLLSEVQATIQRVEGVLSVDVDTLDRVRIDPVTLDADPLGLPASGRLVVETARLEPDGSGIVPAQIALLRPDVPDTLILTEVTS